VHDLINVAWAATLAQPMGIDNASSSYVLECTEHLLESLPLPLLVQLGHILLGSTEGMPSSDASGEGGAGLSESSKQQLLHLQALPPRQSQEAWSRAKAQALVGSVPPRAPSITGYMDAAMAARLFGTRAAADYAVQVLLALRRMEGSRAPLSSKLHQSVSETLVSMGVKHLNEVAVFGGVYHLDILLSNTKDHKNTSIAIEVDGPSHFVHPLARGAGRHLTMNAETKLKRRLLKRLGWNVVSLPYTRWNSARATTSRSKLEQQQELICSLLADAEFDLPRLPPPDATAT